MSKVILVTHKGEVYNATKDSVLSTVDTLQQEYELMLQDAPYATKRQQAIADSGLERFKAQAEWLRSAIRTLTT